MCVFLCCLIFVWPGLRELTCFPRSQVAGTITTEQPGVRTMRTAINFRTVSFRTSLPYCFGNFGNLILTPWIPRVLPMQRQWTITASVLIR